ncbi:hypothetical protein HAX54_013943, partial [Datura stramonium]|nr:hypothetical protein [Datura stramonium]
MAHWIVRCSLGHFWYSADPSPTIDKMGGAAQLTTNIGQASIADLRPRVYLGNRGAVQ